MFALANRITLRYIAVFVCLLCVIPAMAKSLASETGRAFSKIGISQSQSEPYSVKYEEFQKRRDSTIRRVLNRNSGEGVAVKAKKAIRRDAKKSVKDMASILSPLQLKYYAEYVELANKLYLRESGLRH
ncbi:MAG: hypothetical protein ACI96M_003869 [Candidatus Azotimanducaceae bacterium]|jgi:hypothetical protein